MVATRLIRSGLGALVFMTAAQSLPHNPSTILLDPTSNGSLYYFIQSPASSPSTISISTLNATSRLDNTRLPLKGLDNLPPSFNSGDSNAFTPAISDDGSVLVFTGDCSKGSSGSSLWRLSVSQDGTGSWTQAATTPDKTATYQNNGPSANFGASAITFSSTSKATTSKLYIFGGMCPRSVSTISSWQPNADYTNEMLTFSSTSDTTYPPSSYKIGLIGPQSSLVQEAGQSLTGLAPTYSSAGAVRDGVAAQRTKQQNYVLLGGNTQMAFVNMSAAALFSLPQETWAIIPITSGSGVGTITPRSGHTTVLTPDGTRMIVFGGWVGDIDTAADPQLLVLEIGAGYGGQGDWSWSRVDQGGTGFGKDEGIWGHGAAMIDDVMVIIGGFTIPTSGTASPSPKVKRADIGDNTRTLFYNTTSSTFVDSFIPSAATKHMVNGNSSSPSSSTAPSTGPADSPAATNRRIILGTGLGVGIAALIGMVILLTFCLRQRRKLRREEREDRDELDDDDREDELGRLSMAATSPGAGLGARRGGYFAAGQQRRQQMVERRGGSGIMGGGAPMNVYSPIGGRDAAAAERTGLLFEIPSPTRGLRRSLHSRGRNGERFSWVEEPWQGGTSNRVIGSSDIHPIDERDELELRSSGGSQRFSSEGRRDTTMIATAKSPTMLDDVGEGVSPGRPLSSHPTELSLAAARRSMPPAQDMYRNEARNSDPFTDSHQVALALNARHAVEQAAMQERGQHSLIDVPSQYTPHQPPVFPIPAPEPTRSPSPTTLARQSREREIQEWVNDWTAASASLLLNRSGSSTSPTRARPQSASLLEPIPSISRSVSPEKDHLQPQPDEEQQHRANSNLSERSVRSILSRFSNATSGTLTPSRSVSQRKPKPNPNLTSSPPPPSILNRHNSQTQAVNLALAVAGGERLIDDAGAAIEGQQLHAAHPDPVVLSVSAPLRTVSRSSRDKLADFYTADSSPEGVSRQYGAGTLTTRTTPKARPQSFAELSATGPILTPNGDLTPTANISRQRQSAFTSLDDRQTRRATVSTAAAAAATAPRPSPMPSPPDSPTRLRNRATWLGSVSRRWPFSRDVPAGGSGHYHSNSQPTNHPTNGFPSTNAGGADSSSSGTSSFTRRSEGEYLSSGPLGRASTGQIIGTVGGSSGDLADGMMQIGGLWWRRVLGPDGKADWTIVPPPVATSLAPSAPAATAAGSRTNKRGVRQRDGERGEWQRQQQGEPEHEQDVDADDEWDVERASRDRVVQVMFSVPREKLRVVNRADGEVASVSEVSFEEPRAPPPVAMDPGLGVGTMGGGYGASRLEERELDVGVDERVEERRDWRAGGGRSAVGAAVRRKPVAAAGAEPRAAGAPAEALPLATAEPGAATGSTWGMGTGSAVAMPKPTVVSGTGGVGSESGSLGAEGRRRSPGRVETIARLFEPGAGVGR